MAEPTPEEIQKMRERLAEIDRRWSTHNPTFRAVNESGMSYSLDNAHLLVTADNRVKAVFPNYNDAIDYANMGEDVRFLLELVRTRFPAETQGEKTSLQEPKD